MSDIVYCIEVHGIVAAHTQYGVNRFHYGRDFIFKPAAFSPQLQHLQTQ
jgi:hypothetical protein